jgi:hypothetical protein
MTATDLDKEIVNSFLDYIAQLAVNELDNTAALRTLCNLLQIDYSNQKPKDADSLEYKKLFVTKFVYGKLDFFIPYTNIGAWLKTITAHNLKHKASRRAVSYLQDYWHNLSTQGSTTMTTETVAVESPVAQQTSAEHLINILLENLTRLTKDSNQALNNRIKTIEDSMVKLHKSESAEGLKALKADLEKLKTNYERDKVSITGSLETIRVFVNDVQRMKSKVDYLHSEYNTILAVLSGTPVTRHEFTIDNIDAGIVETLFRRMLENGTIVGQTFTQAFIQIYNVLFPTTARLRPNEVTEDYIYNLSCAQLLQIYNFLYDLTQRHMLGQNQQTVVNPAR